MKRAIGLMSGAWYVPGGSLEHGESPEDAVRREIREETCLEVEGLRLFRTWHYQPSDTAHAVAITFTCRVGSGAEPALNEEHLAFRWVTPRYYRDRFFSEEALAALKERPHAHHLVSQFRDVLSDYLGAEEFAI
jgi:ADP-ribose pyrophosphatase YjhB (NUDIX family)